MAALLPQEREGPIRQGQDRSSADVVDNSSASTYEAFNVKLGAGSDFAFARHSGNGLASMDSPSRYFTVK